MRLFEVARLLNNCIDLSHISDNQLSHHYDVQSLIQQQIRQNLVESQIYQQIGTQQLSFYSDSSIYNTTLIPSNINDNIHPVPQNTFEFYLYLPNYMYIYRVTYTELHTFEVAQLLNNSINLYYNIQSLIHQQIQQPVESQIYQDSVQSMNIQVQSLDDNIYNDSIPSNKVISENTQDTGTM